MPTAMASHSTAERAQVKDTPIGQFAAVCSNCILATTGAWRTAAHDTLQLANTLMNAFVGDTQKPGRLNTKEITAICESISPPLAANALREILKQWTATTCPERVKCITLSRCITVSVETTC